MKSLGYTEEELFDYLKQYGEITVAQLCYGFGGYHQAHTRFLKSLVRQGKLAFTSKKGGGIYRLS